MREGGPAMTVLCVDTDTERAERVARELEAGGWAFETASVDPGSATDEASRTAYDCVVVGRDDAFDPGPVVERLREARPGLPVVVFAAEGSERAASEALAAGASDYVLAADGVETLATRVVDTVESEGRYRSAFEEAMDAMLIADDEGQYLDANPAAEELLGAERSEIVGKPVSAFADEAAFEEGWAAFTDDERGTFEIRRPDGETRVVEYAAVRNIVPGEHLSVLRDVTEREARREELERQNERLERFAGVVSHDLRNPLATAEGYLDLARETGESEYFERVARSHERIDRIIGDLLFLAREGREIGSTASVDVAEAVEQAWEIVAKGEEDGELVVEDGLGTVEADDDRFRQLLENVLKNALEHAGPGVRVRVVPTDSGVAIEDDGPGISEADREAAFEHGYTTAEDGTGFGLHIVRRIAEAHGWEVRLAESEAGGARVELAFESE